MNVRGSNQKTFPGASKNGAMPDGKGADVRFLQNPSDTYPTKMPYPTTNAYTYTEDHGVLFTAGLKEYDIIYKLGGKTQDTCGFFRGSANIRVHENGVYKFTGQFPYAESYNGSNMAENGDSGGAVKRLSASTSESRLAQATSRDLVFSDFFT